MEGLISKIRKSLDPTPFILLPRTLNFYTSRSLGSRQENEISISATIATKGVTPHIQADIF